MLLASMDVGRTDVDDVAADRLGASNGQLEVLQLSVQNLS